MLDGQCMLTAVLRRCSSDCLSTAVQDEIPLTTSDLTMSIAAAHRPAVCAASVRTRGTRAALSSGGERRSCSPPRTAMVLRGSESSLMRCGRSITAESGYQLLMLDSPSTGAEDPVVFNAVRLHTALQ